MKTHTGLKIRAAGLVLFSAAALIWNIALSSRRTNFTGQIMKAARRDVMITVQCSSKIEPSVQETVRSLVRGRKKQLHVQEGDAVKEGQLLLEIFDDDVRKEMNQKQISFDNASSDAAKAQKDLRLARMLFKKGAISSREVDDAERALVRAKQVEETASDDLDLVKTKAAGVRVTAPMSGTVLKIFVDKQDDINERDPLFLIAKLDNFLARGLVDELDIADVKVGQSATVVCDAFHDVEMPGRVQWIGSQAKEGAFSDVEVLVAITDTKGLQLKSNLSGTAKITVGMMPNVVSIPARAIIRGKKGMYVLKGHKGGWLTEQPIELSRLTGKLAIIGKGIDDGDSVLVPKEN